VAAVALPYTWDRCAAETLRVYRMLCGIAVPVVTPAPDEASPPRRAAA
jgi:hypothetical protein